MGFLRAKTVWGNSAQAAERSETKVLDGLAINLGRLTLAGEGVYYLFA